MKCNNVPLRDERDSTICIRALPKRERLAWMEWLPFLILGILTAGLIIASI